MSSSISFHFLQKWYLIIQKRCTMMVSQKQLTGSFNLCTLRSTFCLIFVVSSFAFSLCSTLRKFVFALKVRLQLVRLFYFHCHAFFWHLKFIHSVERSCQAAMLRSIYQLKCYFCLFLLLECVFLHSVSMRQIYLLHINLSVVTLGHRPFKKF